MYVVAVRATAGVVQQGHSAGSAEEIVAAADCSLLRQDKHGGSLVLTKAWAKSLLSRMGL